MYHTPYHHVPYPVSSHTTFRTIISHTLCHHIPHSVSSHTIFRIIIPHTLYNHIPYSMSSCTVLRTIMSHTPYHHVPYSVSVKLTCSVCGNSWCGNMPSTYAPAPPLYDSSIPPPAPYMCTNTLVMPSGTITTTSWQVYDKLLTMERTIELTVVCSAVHTT